MDDRQEEIQQAWWAYDRALSQFRDDREAKIEQAWERYRHALEAVDDPSVTAGMRAEP